MQEVYGDLIEIVNKGPYEVVLHCCNCQNTMGAGIAKDIATAWPEAAQADALTTKGDITKLGTYSKALVVRDNRAFTVYNLYGQYNYGPRWQHNLDYVALNQALESVALELKDKVYQIVFPLIGTGNAGGRWRKIQPLITYNLFQHYLTLVKLTNRG